VSSLHLEAVREIPLAGPANSLEELVEHGLTASGMTLQPGDVLVVVSTLVSRVEGCFAELGAVVPSDESRTLAAELGKDPALVELVLTDSVEVSRQAPGVLITRHRLGHVGANAGIDRSNARPPGAAPDSGPWALRLPVDPDASAQRLRHALEARHGGPLGVIISDSVGRAHRLGSVGLAIGLAGLPALDTHTGRPDLHGRVLRHSVSALADQLAAAAELVAGQADEGTPVVRVRGLRWTPDPESRAAHLQRPAEQDLYR